MSDASHIEALTKQLFSKSTTQHHFIEMYTDLCVRLHQYLIENPIIESAEKHFKRILLNQCQENFEQYLKPPPGFEELEGEDRFNALVKYKTSMLGNMKFVGQLLIYKMLSSKIIFQCVDQLIEVKNDETLETLAVFLQTIGPQFDTEAWPRYDQLNQVFVKIGAMCRAKEGIAPRIKCLLKDVLDARATGWKGRAKTNQPEGPMKIAEVARQARREDNSGHGGGGGGRPPPPREREPRQEKQADEWATVASSSQRKRMETRAPLGNSNSAGVASSQGSFGALAAKNRTAKPERSREEEQEKQARKEAKKAKELARQEEEEKAKKTQADAKSMEEFQEELPKCLRELWGSHDVDEAVTRLEKFNLEVDEHEASVAQFLLAITEEKPEKRKLGFKLMAGIFTRYGKSALSAGLEQWFEDEDCGYECMKSDVPKLSEVIEEELLPAISSVLGSSETERIKGLLG